MVFQQDADANFDPRSEQGLARLLDKYFIEAYQAALLLFEQLQRDTVSTQSLAPSSDPSLQPPRFIIAPLPAVQTYRNPAISFTFHIFSTALAMMKADSTELHWQQLLRRLLQHGFIEGRRISPTEYPHAPMIYTSQQIREACMQPSV
jgi:hypothetical protein